MRPRTVLGLVAFVLFGLIVFVAWLVALEDDDAPRSVVAAQPPRDEEPAAATDDDREVVPAAPAFVPAPAQDAAAPADGMAHVEGVVVDRRGAPVASFHLAVSPLRLSGDRKANENRFVRDVHDDGGRFALDVPMGMTAISAVAPGFREEVKTVDVDGDANAALRFVLDPSNALRGVVRDAATRAPIADARVDDGHGDTASTDATGQFEILSLPDERFSVHVTADGYQSLDVGGIRGDRSRDEEIEVELNELGDAGQHDEFVGIGLMLKPSPNRGPPSVGEVFPGAPADEVLVAGDVITDVDGNATDGVGVHNAQEMIRGEVGTTVRIGILREGQAMHFDIARARLTSPARVLPRHHDSR